MVTTIVLFLVFAAGSLLFHDHFVRKARLRAAAVMAEGVVTPSEHEEALNLDGAPRLQATESTDDQL